MALKLLIQARLPKKLKRATISGSSMRASANTLAAICGLAVLSGCTQTVGLIPEPLVTPARPTALTNKADGAAADALTAATRGGLQVLPAPALPSEFVPKNLQPPTPAPVTANEALDVTFNFENLPLPAFIQTVYANMLKRNINIDPVVMASKDLVTLRSGKPMTATSAENSVRLLLKSYGIAVLDFGGLTRIVKETPANGVLPEIRRGRSLPDTPMPLRPVFHIVELQAVNPREITQYLTALIPDKVKVTQDATRPTLLLAGVSDDVAAAVEIIQMLDQPQMKGRSSVRISPQIWSAEELAKKLTEILLAEGYAVGAAAPNAVQFPITLLPISGVNTIVVFSQSKEITNHIVEWAKTLDKPAEKSVGRKYFSYQVKNTDASRLAETLSQLLSGARSPAASAAAAPASTNATATPTRNDGVTVDKSSNTLLFQSTGEDYGDIIRIVRELDQVTRQVMIEVTVAEVNVDDSLKTGVDWFFNAANGKGQISQKTQLSGNSFAGFVFNQLDGYGGSRALLSALATDNRATVVSSPRIFARNGETGKFRSGKEVPVVTSQLTTNNTNGTNALIQNQTVQYRNTGVLVSVKPVIHSSDQVDLEINQEVSSVSTNDSGVGNSPVFSTKNIETKMTLRHGETYVMGGLISEDTARTNSGVPFAKDLPLLGRLFGKNTDTKARTELVMLVTPYILNDSNETRAISDAFRRQLGPWTNTVGPVVESPVVAPKQ
jgi:general secretion pathway protein D